MPRARIALALALTMAAPALVGCLGGEDEQLGPDEAGAVLPQAAQPRCVDGSGTGNASCNYDTLQEPEREGNEVTVAVNPTDPDNVVAGAKDYYPESAGDCVWDGIYHTKDGGESFESRNLPGSPWLLMNNQSKFEANDASQYWCMSDPVVDFGPEGTMYYTFLAYQGDPVTGSAAGEQLTCLINEEVGGVPCSGLNDVAFNRVSIGVMVSEDGGDTISDVTLIDSGTFPVNFHDRQWIATDDESGTVYVAWTGIFTPGNLVYRSHDKGQTWEGPVLLDQLPVAAGTPAAAEGTPAESTSPSQLFVDTGPGDTVYVSGCGPDGPYLASSGDGGESFSEWRHVVEAEDEGMNASYRSGQICMVAADGTDGPHRGNLYMVYAATPDGHRDVFLTRSTDGGQTWSEPIQLDQDDTENDQFLPTISINPNGVVDVSWWDRRNDPDNRLLDVYHRYSLDGGETFSEEARVTDVSSDPTHSLHQGGFPFIGDYMEVDSSEECAWPAWVDTRHEKADVMTTCLERPGEPVVR
jgi:hypothetical protein